MSLCRLARTGYFLPTALGTLLLTACASNDRRGKFPQVTLEAYYGCREKPANSEVDGHICDGFESARLDSALELTQSIAIERAEPSQRAALMTAQIDWRQQSEAKCRSGLDHSSGYYGTLEAEIYQRCLSDLTAERIVWLRRRQLDHR